MTKRMRSTTSLAAAVILVFAGVVQLAAHHGWGEYDSTKPITLTGVIKASGYENPHSFVDLDVNGKMWHAVLAPPSRMQARGITREMLKPNTTVTVMGFPHKTKTIEMKTESMTIGGKTTNIR